jgi:hypothetical protein
MMALRSQVPPGQAFFTRIMISPRAMRGKFPSTSAVVFTVTLHKRV